MQRLLLPIVVPLGALIGTAIIIVVVGLLLLWVGDYRWNDAALNPIDLVRLAVGDYPPTEVHGGHHRWDLGLFDMGAAVVMALLVATSTLVVASLLARFGGSGK